MPSMSTLDTSSEARSRRLQAARLFLDSRKSRGGPGAGIAKMLESDDPNEQRRARMVLAGAAYRAERRYYEMKRQDVA